MVTMFLLGYFAGTTTVLVPLVIFLRRAPRTPQEPRGALPPPPTMSEEQEELEELPERPSDMEIPKEIVRMARLFPRESDRILRDSVLQHKRGVGWDTIIEGWREYLNAYRDGLFEEVVGQDPNWGG